MTGALACVENVTKIYGKKGLLPGSASETKAVSGVSLAIHAGEVVGLVGESACGKSTLGRMFLRLVNPTHGQVFYDGQDITDLSHAELSSLRRHFQMIFQDPYASLNPRMTVAKTIGRALAVHGFSNS